MSESYFQYIVVPDAAILPTALQAYFHAFSRRAIVGAQLYQSTDMDASEKMLLEEKLLQNGYDRVFENFWLPSGISTDARSVLVQSMFNAIAENYESIISREKNIRCYEYLYSLAQQQRGQVSSVLDFGCGTGIITKTEFAKNIERLVGFDFCPEMSAIARTRGLHVIESPLVVAPDEDGFDAILSAYVLHYGLDPKDWETLLGCLKSTGKFVGNVHKDISLLRNIHAIETLGSAYCYKTSASSFGTILEVCKHTNNIC